MSWQAVDWILRFSESTYYERLVLISIASHADKDGKNSYPSLDTISREALVCRREVIYCVQKLEEMGELRVTRGIGRGNPNRYEMPHVSIWLAKRKGAQESVKGAQSQIKGAHFPNLENCNSNRNSDLEKEKVQIDAERFREPKRITVKQFFQSLCVPEPSEETSQAEALAKLRKDRERLKELGYLQ